jgi:hypothetical protein
LNKSDGVIYPDYLVADGKLSGTDFRQQFGVSQIQIKARRICSVRSYDAAWHMNC